MQVVTGANGFLGSYVVCTLLFQNKNVLAVKRESSSMAEFHQIADHLLGTQKTELIKNLKWADGDIEDILSLDTLFENAEKVFHCAAKVSFNGDKAALHKTNAEGTANVVNACLKAKVGKLIYASSTAALGRTDSKLPINEETSWTNDVNNTEYAVSKHLAEMEVWRGIEEGLDAVIVNPGIILGYGQSGKGSCRLFDNVYNGFRFYTNGVNGFVSAIDVAEIMAGLAVSDVKNERYVLVSENISYKELFDLMAEAFGKKSPDICLKASYYPWISWLLKLNTLFNPKSNLSKETLRTSLKEFRYDNSKILKAGYHFESIKETVNKTCRAFDHFR